MVLQINCSVKENLGDSKHQYFLQICSLSLNSHILLKIKYLIQCNLVMSQISRIHTALKKRLYLIFFFLCVFKLGNSVVVFIHFCMFKYLIFGSETK